MHANIPVRASRPTPGLQVLDALLARVRQREAPSDLMAYVNVPFCTSKCTFCDWVKDVHTSDLVGSDEEHLRYAQAVESQMRFYGEQLIADHYKTRLVYWGGGTPTKISTAALERICKALDRYVIRGNRLDEYTVECSPETATPDKLAVLRAHGASRLSIGVQSFNDAELKFAGRAHRVPQVMAAIDNARRAGFRNLNIDLIVGFPGQDAELLSHTMQTAMDCDLQHVSLYIYRATPGTAMVRQARNGGKPVPRGEHVLSLYALAREYLDHYGFIEYGTGYFARSRDLRCYGDMYYYELEGDYLGFGSGAYSVMGEHYLLNESGSRRSFLEDPTAFDIFSRFTAQSMVRQFGALSPTIGTELGMSYERFRRLYGLAFDELKDETIVRNFVSFYESCGAHFVRDEERLYVSPETRAEAIIKATVQIALMNA